MKINNKNILLISPEPWDHIFVSKHHYAVHLAKRSNKVFFLNPPSGPFAISETEYANIKLIDYKGFIKGLRFLPKKLRMHQQRQVINRIESALKLKLDIIWSFDNSVFYDLDAFPERMLKISHIVDLNQDFMTDRASESADICFGVTQEIVQRAKRKNIQSFFINHGFNVPRKLGEDPIELPGTNKLKAMYIGNLAMAYLDWATIRQGIQANVHVDFIFIGPNADNFSENDNQTHADKKQVTNLPNVHFLPKIASDLIPSYLAQADLLFLCYQDRYHTEQSNSHKILEYLYSGKPVVASYTAEYINNGLIEMSHKNVEWPSLLSQVLANLTDYKAPEKIEKRRAWAMQNSYDHQIDKIEDLISSLEQ